MSTATKKLGFKAKKVTTLQGKEITEDAMVVALETDSVLNVL
jgi:hypothetical protein